MENANTGINNAEEKLTNELANDQIIENQSTTSVESATTEQALTTENEPSESSTASEIVAIKQNQNDQDEAFNAIDAQNTTNLEEESVIEEEHEITSEHLAELSTDQQIALLEHIIKTKDLSKYHEQVKEIRNVVSDTFKNEKIAKMQSFIETGGAEEDFDKSPSPLQQKFNVLLEQYINTRNRQKDEQERIKQHNLVEKQSILDQMRALTEVEETKDTYQDFKKLQEAFKQIGAVPQPLANDVWQTYHAISQKFYDNQKINSELKELDFKKNLEVKIELCEKAEALLLEQSINKSIESLSILHEQWKEIGPVPREQKEEVWERFKLVSDKIYDRRRDYYKEINEERKNNLIQKVALCEKIENLLNDGEPSTHSAWNIVSEEVAQTMTAWKQIGFAPKASNNDVWKRFKDACDNIYNKKNIFYKNLRKEQNQQINSKIALCEQAEALSNSTDWKNTTNQLVEMQKQWKALGGTPNKQSDKLWVRFRTACDNFFQNKQAHFADQDANQAENLEKKKAIITKIESFEFSGESSKDMEVLKGFQRDWIEIGHVPLKEKENIQNQYRKLINQMFDKLKMNNQERGRIKYQSKIESIKQEDNSDRLLKKEQFNLQQKIGKIQSDISIWENNIEFFANSKNAATLRKEIEQKIEVAKAEIKSLKEKIKLLNQQNKD